MTTAGAALSDRERAGEASAQAGNAKLKNAICPIHDLSVIHRECHKETEMPQPNYQTTRLSAGKHSSPDQARA